MPRREKPVEWRRPVYVANLRPEFRRGRSPMAQHPQVLRRPAPVQTLCRGRWGTVCSERKRRKHARGPAAASCDISRIALGLDISEPITTISGTQGSGSLTVPAGSLARCRQNLTVLVMMNNVPQASTSARQSSKGLNLPHNKDFRHPVADYQLAVTTSVMEHTLNFQTESQHRH